MMMTAYRLQLVATLVCALVPTSARSQSVPPLPRAPSSAAVVQQFLWAAYPELRNSGWHTELSTVSRFEDRWWSAPHAISVRVAPAGQRLMLDGLSQTAMLDAIYDFPLSGGIELSREWQIATARFNGTHVHSKRLLAFAAQLADPVYWTAADMAAALKESGARFGPGDATPFRNALHLDQLAAALGLSKPIQADVSFRPPSETSPGSRRFGAPHWYVRLQSRGARQRTPCYNLKFEPFDGRFESLEVCR